MTHMIYGSGDMFSVREVPWHGLGTILDNPPTSKDAIIYAGLDWEVKQEPVFRTGKFGKLLEEEGYFFNVRSDIDKVLGLVTDRYRIIQNLEAFQFTDSLIRTGQFKYETAGCLQGGKRVWLLAKLPFKYVLGDKTDVYLCFTHGHDGRHAIKVFITPIRVVCNNTLAIGLDKAVRSWSTKHVGNLKDKLEEARITLGMANSYMDNLQEKAEKLYRHKLDMEKAIRLTDKLIPFPNNAGDRAIENIVTQKKDLMHRFRYAPDLENFRFTGWGYVTAVSDFVTHSEPIRRTAKYKENRFADIISGNTLIDKAINIIAA